jgi:hypothetical protein
VSYCYHWASVFRRLSVVHLSLAFCILINSSKTTGPILNQTLVEWFLDGPLPKLFPVILTSNQDDHQAKNRKRGEEI